MTSTSNRQENCNYPAWSESDLGLLSSYHLEELNQLVSHELRTPLTAIRGALGLLASGRLQGYSEQSQRLLAIAMSNTERLIRLTQAIENEPGIPITLVSGAAMSRLRLELDLRNAITQAHFLVFFQPIVELKSGRIKGFEALARWQHPERGWISPGEFITLAEEIGLIHDLGLLVLRQSCLQLAAWQQQIPEAQDLYVSVNLSTTQLSEPHLISQIWDILTETGVAARSLRLEITESAVLDRSPAALACLKQLQSLGIQLYLDDFGTGYSSLARLQEIPVDVLKIDRSFVSTQNWHLIKVIVMLASGLGLDIIVEGVETSEELAQIQTLDCHLVQGYFFSKPLNSAQATALLKTAPWQQQAIAEVGV
ncbi:MAG: EAL domain-containing protein [Jaaginema sp. PMC 1079.18]|nr:EAL domain-containing protein [Jaaginema sp. PMC 1080.18]MEC4852457.1 EAL domain-containing protein [Jaaginema sp. PMC 1079.18]MEC4867944.1 EAL domain-containing protein [Jaaginema sp. PMC 1078.18]